MEPTTIKKGKYTFTITGNKQSYEERILIHTYKIGGDYDNCVTISYLYNNKNPIKGKIPYLSYEPECTIGSNLERGGGTEIMIKTLLEHGYNEVPSINIFEFDDNSHIDCIDKNLLNKPPRKPKKPLNLAFFSIAYHSYTWYELRFNATMIDKKKYRLYRNKLSFLTNPKDKLDFTEFLKILNGSFESVEQIKYLEKIYNKTNTYREFFEGIPKLKRCDLLFSWLTPFMNYYIGNVFTDKGWEIDVTKMNNPKNNSTNKNMEGGTYKHMMISYNTNNIL